MMGKKNQEEKNTFTSAALLQFGTVGETQVMEEFRKHAVERVQTGESTENVIKTLGFARACIYDWLAKYRPEVLESGLQKAVKTAVKKASVTKRVRLSNLSAFIRHASNEKWR